MNEVDTCEDADWLAFAAVCFFRGYSESDAIYDHYYELIELPNR